MKNLLKRYQLPVSGWECWYFDDDYCMGCDWDDNENLYYHPGPNKYLDNPINILPIKQSMTYDEWNTKYRRHYRRNEAYVRATAIIEHSAGLHSSELFQKVKNCLKYRRTHETVQQLINEHLDKTEMDNGRRYFKNRHGGYESRRYYKYRTSFIFENEDGYIEETTPERVKGTPRDWRRHYERRRWSKKKDREHKRDYTRMAVFYLKVINHPILLDYFRKIRYEYAGLNAMEEASYRDRPERGTTKLSNYWYSWEVYKWRRDRRAFTLEKRRRRDQIRQDLDDMMEGNFSSYYKTRKYLYSIYKECHHFSQP